jgi:hypothetical protein
MEAYNKRPHPLVLEAILSQSGEEAAENGAGSSGDSDINT